MCWCSLFQTSVGEGNMVNFRDKKDSKYVPDHEMKLDATLSSVMTGFLYVNWL